MAATAATGGEEEQAGAEAVRDMTAAAGKTGTEQESFADYLGSVELVGTVGQGDARKERSRPKDPVAEPDTSPY